jgi:YidC/Oxa1 family membrane protein insertase
MFDGFFKFIAGILAWFYSLVPNYGIAIALLTISVMIVITPLTLKSTRSMIQMQRLQPELKRLQEKYKGDREKLNTELMAFYKEHDLNPLSGCIPVVAQLPIFILLYNVLRGITVRHGGPGSPSGHVAGQLHVGQTFTPWKLHDQPFNPKYLAPSSEMYHALTNTTKMKFLGLDLSLSPLDAIRIGLVFAIPFLVLMVLLLVSQVIQNRQIQGRTKNQQKEMPAQQQALMKIMPFFLPVISIGYPAGLGWYYLLQGLCRVGTQSYITRKFYGDDEGTTTVIDTGATEKPTVDGGDTASKAKALLTGSGRSKVVRPGPANGAAKKPSSSAQKQDSSTQKPGSSVRSQAAQKKAANGGKSSGGRRSGAPRSGDGRRSGLS